jgi:hypothetical protein
MVRNGTVSNLAPLSDLVRLQDRREGDVVSIWRLAALVSLQEA